MNILTYQEQLELLELPVLSAQLRTLNIQIDRALIIARGSKQSMDIKVVIANEANIESKVIFRYPAPELIPPEFKKSFHDYATRLIGERHILEAVIDDKILCQTQDCPTEKEL